MRYFERGYISATIRKRFGQSGPIIEFVDGFVDWLYAQDYSVDTVQRKLWVIAELNGWLRRRKLSVESLGEDNVNAFEAYWKKHRPKNRTGLQSTLVAFCDHVRRLGIQLPPPPEPTNALDLWVHEFGKYLEQERRLSTTTIRHCTCTARDFLQFRFNRKPVVLSCLKALDVREYITHYARRVSPGTVQAAAGCLRHFLRFLFVREHMDVDLRPFVPKIAFWRLSNVPKYLQPDEVERVLRSCDTSTLATGVRDFAILLLLIRLGLRASEVMALTLDDIDWRAGEIEIHGKGRVSKFPLLDDVGKALVHYLQSVRPRSPDRRLFLRMYAPHRGFIESSAIAMIVNRALKRAGLDPPRKGAHLLRHSLATEMLRKGADLYEIGDLLGHDSTETTQIYAKCDLSQLRELALPWPTGGENDELST